MQKTRFIPTPLSDPRERPAVQVVQLGQHSQSRVFRRLTFVLTLLFRQLAVRLWPRLGHEGGRFDALNNARFIRLFCESMGGLWVKVGQILAMRRDAFSQVFCDELARLHDRATGFPGEIAREIIERELGPVDEFFVDFEVAPMAAASIAQIHQARLRDSGLRVVIKVQRPDVAAAFVRDLKFLKGIVRIVKFLGVLQSGRWDEMLWELDKTFTEELDYRLEASSISRMRKQLRKHKVYVPKVFQALCTRCVLVMELVEGVFMSEYIRVASQDPDRVAAWNVENNVSPTSLGEKLYLSHLRQVFEDNLYHCDLHPGNVIILRNNRFALIDFGSIASFERSFLEKYSMMFKAIAMSDFTKVVDIMLMTSPALPDVDLTDLRAELVRSMRAWELKTSIKRAPYHEKSLTAAMAQLAETLGKYKVPPAWEYLRLQRAEITLDSALSLLLPSVNYVKLARKYMEKAQQRGFAQMGSKMARRQLVGSLGALAALPQRMGENITFDAESTLVDELAAADTAARVIALQPGVKLFLAVLLVATLVLVVRIRRRLTVTRGYNPGTGYW
jgi:ubiquinone biosynthesis protein